MSKLLRYASVFCATSILLWSSLAEAQNFMFPAPTKNTVEGPVMPPITSEILSPEQFSQQVTKINSQNNAAFKQELNSQLAKIPSAASQEGLSTPPPIVEQPSTPPPAAAPITQTPPPATKTPTSGGPAGTFQQPANKPAEQNSGGWNIKY
ncbi:hypothetical protein AYO45_02415 [Gammaproteobacteria bacterium SCGC AG-212-F23]|nr:hypothetical protein AYO45_02415 [Gammaproteobacteria bacterium SCGC AG-212-F23]